VGTTVEFRARGSFKPLTDMVGGGPFDLLPGQWTDDTSMALCLASSLVECGGFDARDQMQRYCRWQEQGYLSSTGECFDIGRTVAAALDRFRERDEPLAGSKDPLSAGNGSLMRLAPVPIPNLDGAERFAAESSRTTHGAAECVDACRLFSRMICRAFEGRDKDEVVFGDADKFVGSDTIKSIAKGSFRGKPENGISGSGYVVASLEAALWSFFRTDSFADAVLTAANLGDDADTTAAICGQIAGAYYGAHGIPAVWLQRLSMREEIMALADRLAADKQGAA
jgi:ADP-ribosyl-[dinitrogen reductase] hydrolase